MTEQTAPRKVDTIEFACSHGAGKDALVIEAYQFPHHKASHLVFNTQGLDIHLDSIKVRDLITYLTSALEGMDEGDNPEDFA